MEWRQSNQRMQLRRLAGFVRNTVKFVNFPVVRVFADGKLDLLPEKWLEGHKNVNLSQIASCFPSEIPSSSTSSISTEIFSLNIENLSFTQFVSLGQSLSILSEEKLDQKQIRKLNKARNRELTFKKSVELECFGRFLVEKCEEKGITRVVDVGCGLGHLLGWIGKKLPDVELVGVDCNSGFCDKGKKIYGDISFNSVEIGAENSGEFLNLLEAEDQQTALISLHGCGDLQETLIKLFLEADGKKVPLLLTIGCCYHKTKKPNNNEWILSDFLTKELQGIEVNGSAMRMAAEMRFPDYVKMSAEERERRLNALTIRAMVEVFYQRMGINAKDEHRSKRRKLGSTIAEVAETLSQRYSTDESTKKLWTEQLNAIEREFGALIPKVQLLLDIQYSLQPVMESLILLDRLQYVAENGVNATLIPLFPTQISPRNSCLNAER
ncbi:unnamed protein product [Bursaphelenchus xylophilus]|uniref:(pine wood nematode) hypothetical protein n=1 Tax=Bursaphelenchus xylophilus TaxID=6326 RepID=A0A1I7SE60_BURXY|nr:unnamed protein product [Bursaphelenchus xylophilus]CAG9104146.1 unnamed protein product [Bursaphelenchus xylophilus]